jgi:hypothetical protein
MKQKLARLQLQKNKADKESKHLGMEIETLQKTLLDQYSRKMESLGCMYVLNEISLPEIEKLCELYLFDQDDPITVGGRPLSGLIFKKLEQVDLLDDEGVAYIYLPLMKLSVFDNRKTIPSALSYQNTYVCVYNLTKPSCDTLY